MKRKIRIGTRKSKLALWQANFVGDKIKAAGGEVELVTMESIGDKNLSTTIAEIGTKGAFTEELEQMLETGDIDIAVHSAKDLPSSLPEGFFLIAAGPREKSHDVLISHHEDRKNITDFEVIGTSSVRRRALLKGMHPKAAINLVRGNLQTRIAKMEGGHCDALLLAFAGVHRMGFSDRIVINFDIQDMPPVAGQGIVGVEAHYNLDIKLKEFIRKAVNDGESMACLEIERQFFRTLEGGCGLPGYVHCIKGSDGFQVLGGVVEPATGKRIELNRIIHDNVEITRMAEQILNNGGKEILDDIKKL